ncbi:MAG: His/Gly/Thr/Pro-type tRNA ligase C-terminal domain-containing protein [Minisyncoccia bacterium]
MKKNNKKINSKISNGGQKFVNFHPIDEDFLSAIYYGFTTTKVSEVTKEDKAKTSSLKENWAKAHKDLHWLFSENFVEERASFLRHFTDNMVGIPQPATIAYESNNLEQRGKKTLNLEVIGTEKSIAEAILIKTAVAILKDNGAKDITIDVNSIGDKDSINKFTKDLVSYYKKNLNNTPACCRQNFKKDPFYAASCQNKQCLETKENIPNAITSLSDDSRRHFTEVLEYIETMGIPYNINKCLLSDRKYCSQAVFEIKGKIGKNKKEEVLAIGFRYDGLAQKLGFKKDLMGVGIKIFLDKNKKTKFISKIKKPKIFFIQISDEAKQKSFEVIEILRKAKILVYHFLGRDKFGSQSAPIEKLKVPYVMIMGKRESLENTVMVRENLTRTQVIVPLSELADYIKKLE